MASQATQFTYPRLSPKPFTIVPSIIPVFHLDPILSMVTVLILALIAFITEWLPVDLTAMGVAIALILLGLVTPDEGISGFGNSATITVLAMFILSAGIVRTGAVQTIRTILINWGGNSVTRQILTMGMMVGPITALINNTAVVGIFLPIVEDWCKKKNISPSKLMIPLSYSTVLGGMITVIGTSTNVLASGLSQKLGYGEFYLFQFTPIGLITFLVGIVYLAVFAPKLLPDRKQPNADLLNQDYALTDYVSEVIITPQSNLIGQTLRSTAIQRNFDIDVLEIIRDNQYFAQPVADKPFAAGDILLVRGSRQDLLKIRDERGLDILPEVKFSRKVTSGLQLKQDMNSGEEHVAEILILSNSRLNGATLKELRFRQRYNATVLAIRRGQELIRERLGRVPLKFGDLLLLQGPKESFLGLQTTRELLVLEQRDAENLRQEKAGIAIAIVLGVVLISAFNITPILVAALIGVILMVLTGCLKPGRFMVRCAGILFFSWRA
jgi:di/tricarboxylate transporter